MAVPVPSELPSWLKNSDLHQNRTLLELSAWTDLTLVPMPRNELAWSAIASLATSRAAERLGMKRLWRAAEATVWLTRNLDADVILSHYQFPETLPWVRRLPLVWGPAYDPSDREWRAKRSAEPRFLRRLAQSSGLFFTNAASAEALIEDVPEVRAKVVIIPIFEPHLPPAALPMRSHAPGLRVLFVGRMARHKNLARVVSAVDRLRAERDDVSLTVVSDFRDGPVAVPAYAKVIGGQSQAEVFTLMQQHDALCMPSSFETYGMVFIEALAAGMAVIAPDRPIQRAMLGPAARYTQPDNVEQLTQVLRDLCDPAARAFQIGIGREHYRRVYCPQMVAQSFARALKHAAHAT